mgnify:CR=1 FL=1
MEVVHDQLATGRKLRVLTIVDTFSRFSPALDVRFNFRSSDQSVDPVMVAVTLTQALQTIVSRNVAPLDTAIVSITQIHAGSAYNVVPGSAHLSGTIRTFKPEVQALVVDRMRTLASSIAAGFGASASVAVHPGYSALINTPLETEAACAIARTIVGENMVASDAEPLTGSEDFAEMLLKRPGTYLWLGQGEGANLHNPAYRFNDEVIPVGASLYARLAEGRLQSANVALRRHQRQSDR